MNQAPYLLPATGWFQILAWSSSPLSDSSLPSTQPPSRHAKRCGTYPPAVMSAFSEEMHLRRMPARLTAVAVDTVFHFPRTCSMSASGTVDLALMITLSGSTNEGIWVSGVDACAVAQSSGSQ